MGTDLSYWGEVDVDKKIAKFLRVSGLINRMMPAHNVRRKTRLRVYNIFAMPDGCEVWALKKRDKQRLTAAEMRFMRRTAGYKLRDRKRSEDMLKVLNVIPKLNRVKNYRKKWRDHVGRMEEERPPKLI